MNSDDKSSKIVDSVIGATRGRKKGAGRSSQKQNKDSNRAAVPKKCSKYGS